MTNRAERPAPRFDWFIPIDGDGEHIGTLVAERPPTFEYLRSVVETAEAEGFYSLLIPTRFLNGLFDEKAPLAETWTMVSALAAVTKRIRFLIAVRPGFISTGLFAQMAATLDQLSDGRIDLNIVPGGIPGEYERFGDAPSHDQRYDRAEEFIAALRLLWERPEPVTFEGKTIQLRGALASPGPVQARGAVGTGPQFYVGGASPRALRFAANQADVFLAWILPRLELTAMVSDVREQFAMTNRTPSFGLRTHLVLRNSEAEAWDAADDLLSRATNLVKTQRQAVFAHTPMVGQTAQLRADVSAGAPRLWNGISAVRVNCGTAIVGDPDQIVSELLEYWRLGFDEFILSGYPHVEECRRVARQVLPQLRTEIEHER